MPEMPVPGDVGGAGPEVPPSGPAASPMSNPTEQEGLKAQAMQGIQLAIKLLESALLPFGSQSPEGKKLLSAVNSLSKLAGPGGGPDMNQAQVKMLNAKVSPAPLPSAPPPGGGGPGGGMPMGQPMPRPM